MQKYVTMATRSIGASLNDTNTLSDPENSQSGTRIWHLSPLQAEL